MSGIEIHQEPTQAYRYFAPCSAAATATWDVGDPVRLVTNQLQDLPDDTTEALIAELIGFACEPAEGITARSRATNAADGFGVVTNQMRSYWPFDAPGLLLRTRNFWSDAAAADAGKEGTEIGDLVSLVATTGTNVWGFEETAPTAATEIVFQIISILDEDMNPIDAAATIALGTAPPLGQGWIVVRCARALLSQLTEGGA
ncbi:MAG: hypothetical protein A2139_02375 [Desulfobacca sp. RBG_16_60_12]|nr:MAG: hypothetical protein A2139_02375 [Desulfobacca sp. RBG_16_60_12]